MTSPRISVIVPVYNAERTLPRCLDSLLSQTLSDLELIVVNDGSTDDGGAVVERFRARDPRVRVVDLPNGGVSGARNAGLEAVRGEFTAFVDADDWASPELLESLLAETSATGTDIVMCTYMREYEGRSIEKRFDLPERVRYTPAETRGDLLRRLVGPLGRDLARPEHLDSLGTVWGKAYRSSLLKDNGLRFVDLREIGSNEDGLFNLHAFAAARNTVFIRKPLYHYRRDNPASLTSAFRPRLRQQWENLFARIEAFIRNRSLPEEFRKALSNRRAVGLFGLARNALHPGNGESLSRRCRRLGSLLKDGALSLAVRKLPLASLPLPWRVFFQLARRRMTLPLYAMLKAGDAAQSLLRAVSRPGVTSPAPRLR